MRARYYDPTTGRFISRDPIEGFLRDPQSYDSYSYSLNNPTNKSDSSGLTTYGLCFSCSVGLGVYGSASICGAVASNGSYGLVGSAGWGGITGATAGGGISYQQTSDNSISGMSGTSTTGGGSVKAVVGGGVDVSKSTDPSNPSTGFSVGPQLGGNFTPDPFPPAEVHGGVSYSSALDFTNLVPKAY